MSVGRMRNIVWLAERQGDTRQTGGDRSGGALKIVAQQWAEITPGAGARQLQFGNVKTAYPYVVKMHNDVGHFSPTENHVIVLIDGSVLTIHSIVNDNMLNARLTIVAHRTGFAELDGKSIAEDPASLSINDTIIEVP